MEKICVVMPSYLGEYPGCATNREEKFKRAVESYISQDYQNKMLVIVADGCHDTVRLFQEMGSRVIEHKIYLVRIAKQPTMSGSVRTLGVMFAKQELQADIMTYLDTDDYILPRYLSEIATSFNQFSEAQWIWYSDISKQDNKIREVKLQPDCIGTSNFSHRSSLPIVWGDGYGHDWKAVSSILKFKNQKVDIASYIVCHQPNAFDL